MIPFMQRHHHVPSELAIPGKQRSGLRGPILMILRGIWFLVVLFEVVTLLMNFPAFLTLLHTTCKTGADCKSIQLHGAQVPALAHAGFSMNEYALYALGCDLVITLLFLVVGALIFWHKSGEPMGLFVSLLMITFGTFGMDEGHLVVNFSPLTDLMTLIILLLQWPALGLFFSLFPDGRFVPRWSWILMSLFVIQFVFYVLPYPYDLNDWPPLLSNIEWLVVYGSAAGTQIYRYRAVASPLQRQQIKWLAFGFGIVLVLNAIFNLPPLVVADLSHPTSLYHLFGPLNLALTYLPIPLGVGIALLRYRLWDIDILVNRTLVYVLLTACTLSLYVLIVFGASTLLRPHNDLLFSALATALIAVLFQPLRERLQQGVNRLMFGDRNEPYRVLASLGMRLEETLPADALLPSIVKTVAQALKLPYVAIVWRWEQAPISTEAAQVVASFGTAKGCTKEIRVPLIHQGEPVGELLLAPRQRGEELTPVDLRLVRDLAPQIGMAVHAARLTTDLQRLTVDLQRSRERLVTAREEERRRLRRDLHDGLGPQLSSQTLTLSAIRKLLHQDPEKADQLLVTATAHAQEAIVDIRRLVYALRPPALDDLGLLAALQEHISHSSGSGLVLTLEAPKALPPLPAAVEVACYRIVQEALTNIIRHAHATHAAICLRVHESLIVEVSDNGQGLPPLVRSGVGLTSMRERAEELGGTCQVSSLPEGGTCVCARLPLLIVHQEVQPGNQISQARMKQFNPPHWQKGEEMV